MRYRSLLLLTLASKISRRNNPLVLGLARVERYSRKQFVDPPAVEWHLDILKLKKMSAEYHK